MQKAEMTGLIAVHCGAGTQKEKNFVRYKKLSKTACQAGIQVLKQGGTALDAVKAAIIGKCENLSYSVRSAGQPSSMKSEPQWTCFIQQILEDNPLTNAGFGSNLTRNGHVEGDASIMDGKTLLYGGCGAVQKVKNPIELAYDICLKQSNDFPLGLVPPSLLVGSGALRYATSIGLKTVSNNELISAKAQKQYQKYKKLLEVDIKSSVLDTVGAVCVDNSGHVASACSSGGLLLKRPGRVGQGALHSSGVWADSFNHGSESSVAVCTTGCGEHIIRTQLAKEIGTDLRNCSCPITGLHESMTNKFINSRHLSNINEKLGGVLVLHISSSGEGSLLWGHTTQALGVGYMKTSDIKAKSIMSTMPADVKIGAGVSINGVNFYLH